MLQKNKLGDAADGLNKAIETAEMALASLNLGVTADVPLESYGTLVVPPDLELVYKKRGNEWKLLVRNRADDEENFLSSMSRDIRLAAVRVLPALREALKEEAEEQLAEVIEATELCKAFIRETRGE